MKKKIIIGTRGSELAVAQTKTLQKKIMDSHPDYDVDIKIIKTLGDIKKDVRLQDIDRKGIFTKEIEDSLVDGSIDIAVHSMKDMPSDVNPLFHFPITLERENPSDVLIMREGLSFEDFKLGQFKIGTGSIRRIFFCGELFKNSTTIPIRGNITTRIRKIEEMGLDGVILAKAGINRLNLSNLNEYVLPESEFMPPPCQGLLAIQTLKSNKEINEILAPLNHVKSYLEMTIERAFMTELNGGCHVPMAINLNHKENSLEITGLFGSEHHTIYSKKTIETDYENAEKSAISLAIELKEEVKRRIEEWEKSI